MRAVDPRGEQPAGPKFSFATGAAIGVALAVGGLLQEARWRGGLSNVTFRRLSRQPSRSSWEKSRSANGNDAVALNLFDRFAAENDAVAQYWLAHMMELGIGVPKDIYLTI